MIKLILGLILALIPFILISRFKEKKYGFFYVLVGIMLFNVITSILTQAVHIFSYSIVLLCYLILDFAILIYCYKRDEKFKELCNNIKKIKIDWILVFVIIILFICLYSVHYNYSGKITTISEPLKEVNNLKLVYPYYSDEWVSVSLIKYSIENKALAFSNPLWKNSFFANFEFATHSFLSGIIVLLGLNPLTGYSLLTLFFGLLICIVAYFVLRFNEVKRIPAAIASLSIPYITNGVNLPGLWYLLPITLGILFMLIGIIFMSINDRKMSLVLGFLVLLFYPPLFVFYTFSILAYILFSDYSKKEKIKYFAVYFGICIIVAVLLSAALFIIGGYATAFNHILSKIFYNTFTMNGIPDYSIWKVIPIAVLLLSFAGIIKYYRKKLIISLPLIIGLIYWILYSKVLWRVIIEYQRVVFATSILIVLFAGFGLDYIFSYLENKKYFREYNIINIIKIIGIIILAILFILSFNYTNMNNWNELKLHGVYNNEVISPAAPATDYLNAEDLRIFENIKEKTFISFPWKGLVIGVATNNYPTETKPSTITVKIASYSDFINANCKGKKEIAEKFEIDYAYTPEFNCSDFKFVYKSNEGLYFYEVKK